MLPLPFLFPGHAFLPPSIPWPKLTRPPSPSFLTRLPSFRSPDKTPHHRCDPSPISCLPVSLSFPRPVAAETTRRSLPTPMDDGSLHAIFLRCHGSSSSCSIDNNTDVTPQELQLKLISTSMELEKVKAEEKLQETKLWHLQELLDIIRKERDDAREECRKLQECFLGKTPSPSPLPPPPAATLPKSFHGAASIVSSSSLSPHWNSLQELEDHILADDAFFCAASPAKDTSMSTELEQAIASFSKTCHGGEDELDSLLSCVGQNQEAFDLQILAMDEDLCFNTQISDLRRDGYRGVQEAVAGSSPSPSTPTTVRAHSPLSESSSLSDCNQLERCISSLSEEGATAATAAAMEPRRSTLEALPEASIVLEGRMSTLGKEQQKRVQVICPTTPAAAITMAAEWGRRYEEGSSIMQRRHLPEPPEADPRVMLSCLPEKGKLLQAVMRAGPLLQTLLMAAGPMPRWRNPPPAQPPRGDGGIMPVSGIPMTASGGAEAPSSGGGFLVASGVIPATCGGITVASGSLAAASGGNHGLMRSESWSSSSSNSKRRSTNADPCRKLRKLVPSPSPASSPDNTDPVLRRMMHMLPASSGMMPYPPTIY